MALCWPLPSKLHGTLDVSLLEFFADLIQGGEHVVQLKTLHRFSVNELIRELGGQLGKGLLELR